MSGWAETWSEVRCEDCGHLNVIKIVYPGDPDRDTCESCDSSSLDWEGSEAAGEPGPDPDSLHDHNR